MTGFGKISLNTSSKVFYFFSLSTSKLHGALGCHPPNLEAVAQAVFALQHWPRKGVTKAIGHVLYSIYYYCMSYIPYTITARLMFHILLLHVLYSIYYYCMSYVPYTITACLRDTMN